MILPSRIRPDLLASKSEGRYAMHHVALRMLDGSPILEATDGRVLGRWTLELEEGERWFVDSFEEALGGVLLDREALGRGLRRGGASASHRLVLDPDGLGMEWRDGTRRELRLQVLDSARRVKHEELVAAARWVAGEWPATERVLEPTRGRKSKGGSVHVDPRILAQMALAAGDDSPVEITTAGPKDPIRFATRAFEGLVMPITLEV